MPGILAFVLIIFGLLHLLKPEIGWYLSDGWKFKDAEPSEAALILGRIGGFIALIIGLFGLFS